MSNVVSMKQLLEAGVHFGHPTKKWNPKMKRYIYTARNEIYIINLEKTVGLIDEAYAFVKKTAEEGKNILFVGTKKQAQEAIMQEAVKCGMYYVNQRWLGGMLTNFATIRSRVEWLNKLNQMEQMNEFALLPKKEVLKLKAERDKLEINLGGIKNMRSLPGAVFVVDPKKEHLAVAEARNLNIPVVGIVDTNCDPDLVDYIIPGNDDAIRAIKLIAGAMSDAVIEAREGEEGLAKRREIEAQMQADAAKAEAEAKAEATEKAEKAAFVDEKLLAKATSNIEKKAMAKAVESEKKAARAVAKAADEAAEKEKIELAGKIQEEIIGEFMAAEAVGAIVDSATDCLIEPEIVPEVVIEPIVETVVEVQPEPEIIPEPVVEVTPEIQPDLKAVVEAAPIIQSEIEVIAEAAPEVVPEAVAGTAPEVKPEPKAAKPRAKKSAPKTKPKAEPNDEPKAE